MSDLLVVGGGVMGMAVALEALSKGVSVTLLEKDTCGAGASQASAGILSPAGMSWSDASLNALCWSGIRRYPAWIGVLQECAKGDPELHMEGVLYPVEAHTAERAESLLQVGLKGEWIKEQTLGESFGWLRVPQALFIREEGRIHPRHLLYQLRDALIAKGCVIREGSEVVLLQGKEGSFSATTSKGDHLQANRVVMTTGAWSLKSPQGWVPPVKPMRGQLIELHLLGENPPTHTLHGESAYMVPQGKGALWIGSMVEDKGWDETIDRSILHRRIARIAQWVPGICQAKIGEAWCGFRPGSPDDCPIIGAREEEEGLFWATGLFRNGILLAPEVASMFGAWWDGIRRKECPFSPDRFAS
ncbi:FAD-dependent oxidoreductase [bacterium]|nr:FAD-dependent oxidoreductase [bacterium]